VSTSDCSPGVSGDARSTRTAQLHTRDALDLTRIDLGADPLEDVRSVLLALERVRKRGDRIQPVERECGLGGNGLEESELVGPERSLVTGGGDRQHADHALVGDHRDERAALCAQPLHEPLVDPRRAFDVVHGDRRGVESRARDARRLVAEVDAEIRPPVGPFTLELPVDPERLSSLCVDDGDPREPDVEQGRDLTHELARDLDQIVRAAERGRDRCHGLELTVPRRDPRLGLQGAAHPSGHERPVTPARKHQQRGHERRQDRGERDPRMSTKRPALHEDEDTEDRGGDGDPREHSEDRPVQQLGPSAAAPKRRQHRPRHRRICGGEQKQRQAVEQQRFGCLAHRAVEWYADG
jgi:hypothetical protein